MTRLRTWMRRYLGGRGSFRRSVAVLLSGAGLAFTVGYAAKLVLLRLYPPEAFGVFDFIASLVGLLIPVAALRYEDAIVLPERDESARDVLLLAGGLTLAASVLSIPIVFGVAVVFHRPEISGWLWTVPPLLLVLRASKLGELWLTRRQRFGPLAAGSVLQATTMTVSRILAGVRSASPLGLIGGFALGHGAAALLYARRVATDLRALPRSAEPVMARVQAVASRYRRFPVYAAPATMVNALATRLPFLLLLYFFDARVLGLFGQAFAVLYVPLSLAGNSIGQVFFPAAAAARTSGDVASLTGRVHGGLVGMALVPCAVVAAAGPELFAALFGDTWTDAGRYASWIAPWVAVTAIGSPLTRVFDVLERQRLDLGVNLLGLLLLVAALIAGGASGSPEPTLIALSAAGTVARALQIGAALRAAGVPFREATAPYLRHGAEAIVAAGVIWLAASWLNPTLLVLLSVAVAGSWLLLWMARQHPHSSNREPG